MQDLIEYSEEGELVYKWSLPPWCQGSGDNSKRQYVCHKLERITGMQLTRKNQLKLIVEWAFLAYFSST